MYSVVISFTVVVFSCYFIYCFCILLLLHVDEFNPELHVVDELNAVVIEHIVAPGTTTGEDCYSKKEEAENKASCQLETFLLSVLKGSCQI